MEVPTSPKPVVDEGEESNNDDTSDSDDDGDNQDGNEEVIVNENVMLNEQVQDEVVIGGIEDEEGVGFQNEMEHEQIVDENEVVDEPGMAGNKAADDDIFVDNVINQVNGMIQRMTTSLTRSYH